MKIPEGTEEGYYWVKFATNWHPAFVWKTIDWCFGIAGFATVYKEKDIAELGQRIEHPLESIGEISHADHGTDPEGITIAPEDWIKVNDWVDPDDGEVRICGARYAKMKECERIVDGIQALVKKSMEVYIGYAEEFGIDKREGWTLAVNKIVVTEFAKELGDLFVEEKA